MKQSQRWQFRSASCASLVPRTVWPSRSWFAPDHTSSSSAGRNIVIVNNIIFFFCSAGTHTVIVVSFSSSHVVSQHFSAQGFQTCWAYGDHGLPNACSRHCQVLEMSFPIFSPQMSYVSGSCPYSSFLSWASPRATMSYFR